MTTLSLPGWAGQAAYQRNLQRSRSGIGTPVNSSNPGNALGAPVQSFNTDTPVQTTSLKAGDVSGPALNQHLIGSQDQSSPPDPGYYGPGDGSIGPDDPLYFPPGNGTYVEPGFNNPIADARRVGGFMDSGGTGGWSPASGTGYFSPQGNYYTFSSPNGWWVGPSGNPAAIQANNNPGGLPGFQGGSSGHAASWGGWGGGFGGGYSSGAGGGYPKWWREL